MKFFSNIPKGLIVFLGGIIVLIVLVLGYQALLGTGNAGGASGGNTNSLFSALFPFGSPASPGNAASTTNDSSPLSQTQQGGVAILREVSATPVSGGWFAANPTSTSTPLIRYMDRETGHVTATPADSVAETRISNTTVPGMEELYPVSDLSLVLRSFSGGKISNFVGTMNATSSEQSLALASLAPFDRIAADKNAGTWLTVTEVNGGSRIDLYKDKAGGGAQTMFASPIASWVPLIAGGRAFLETAPTAGAAGYLYELKNGSLSKIVGGLPGLVATVSPSGRYAAYSSDTAGGFALFVLDTTTGATLSAPVPTLALKCAWIPNHEPLLFCAVPTDPPEGAYPDDWLLGNVSFSDNAWVVNPQKSIGYVVGTLTDQTGAGLDAENISVDSSGTYALFMNKKDLSLWSLWVGDVVTRAAQ